ncbi:hypothetical protein [Arenimonas donghaensis]|uniref:Major facilitator superfamily (MFS) profile domain-containing protein n=1 Tax=Arenimonas donghaensis DSM 18148 = HO3-R19 TaxID=1121014 RepID=A0A087MJ09_9GAMM|nr:hypothetical protein [Arenimonas donghaensis]KFL36862.1 hypothetical protein N788_04390 [Arenimonas donghaensis DSM 18148 = HO3-R19]
MNTVAVAPLKHSGLGIAATIIAIIAGLGLLGVFGYAGYVGMEQGGQPSETDPRMVMVGMGMLAAMALLVLGAILGAVGLFAGARKRLFAWLGLVLNLLPLLLGIVIVVVGLAMAP